ncbi:MAG TPA: carboxypeptidase regulatory-like domain-containing protein [Pyrinomonadaceae bacterium]|nr:carboxypeptidase regulatory-like domain-containing protein [Pyrinomonadaceae bacterium]
MQKLFILAVAVVLAVAAQQVYAQGNAALTGAITDPNGAVVAGATVKATNTGTNISYDTQSTDAGLYRFPTLPVGTYKISVEASGFKSAQVENVTLTVGQTVTRDIKLEIGAPTETVTVQSGGEQLAQPSESSVSALLNRNVWENYPLENRDTNEFLNILPGSVPDEFAGSTRGAAVNGTRGGMGNFLVEGYDNNDQGQGGRGALVSGGITSISPDAIEEYRVITNNYSAQYGKAGGFVTDTVLRSGTNDWHGSLFEYNRVQALAANDFFSNREGVKDSLVRNQFGGSFGGPIRKDKTFGFGTVEFHRLRQGFPLTATSTTQQFINFVQSGAFATFHETSPNGYCVVKLGAPCPGAFSHSRTLGANFQRLQAANPLPLATSNFSNVAAGLFTGADLFGGDPAIVYPVPVYGDVTVINNSFLNASRFTGKVDHIMSARNRFTGTFLLEDSDTGDTHGGGDTTIGPAFLAPGRSILAGITWVHDFSPTMINEAKASYLRHRRDFAQCPGSDGQPSVVTGIDPLGVGFGCSSNLPQFFTDNQFQYQDAISFVRGVHSFKSGVEYRRIRNGSAFEAIKNGFFLPHGVEELLTDAFFGDEADLVSFGEPVLGGFTFAQASINPQTGKLPEYYRGYRANEWAAYFQDDWKVRRNLTLNLGLRWEYFGPPHNFRPGIDSNFYFGSGDTPVPNATANPFFPTTSPLAAEVARGSFQQRDHEIWKKDFNNFAPRVGFAWDVRGDQKLVIRGGGAISYDRIWNNLFENIRFNAPFFSFATVGAFGGGAGVPAGPLSTPGLFNVPFTEANTELFNNPLFNPVPSPRHMDQNLVTPYVQQFNLGVQYEFAKDFLFETNYIMTQGRNLTGIIDINTFNGRTRGGTSRRPNPSIGGDNFRTNAFSSIYHGAQFIVRNRAWHGLQFNTHYTFAHAIDAVSDAFNNRAGQRPMDNTNIKLDRARADFDIRHRFVSGFTYELPFLKGNRWLGGWVMSGVVQLQSGVPFSVFNSAQDPNADGYFTDRAAFIGSTYEAAYLRNQSPADGFFNVGDFVGMNTLATSPAFGSGGVAQIIAACGPGNGVVISTSRWWCNGTSGRNILTGPNFTNIDFGVHKKFRVTEKTALQLQANAFNLLNHPNFGLPVSNLNSSQVGRSINTVGTPRVIQLALRFDF